MNGKSGAGSSTVDLIYFGNAGLPDPKGGTSGTGHADTLVGRSADAGTLQIVSVSKDGADSNDNDLFRYDLGAGPVSAKTDATLIGTVRITDSGGVEQNVRAVLIEANNGDLFLGNVRDAGTLDGLEIASMEIRSVSREDRGGWAADRAVDDTTIASPSSAALPSPKESPDGTVDGEATGETMVLGYDDSNPPTDQGGDRITTGDDVIFGNGGDDFIDGDAGNDVIYGDTGAAVSQAPAREALEWSEAPDFGDNAKVKAFSQTTGDVTVDVSLDLDGIHPVSLRYSTLDVNVDGIDTGALGPVNNRSSLRLRSDDEAQAGTIRLSFSAEVRNVDFRLSDLDLGASISVFAYDASGARVAVSFVDIGSKIKVEDEDDDGVFETVEDTNPETGDGRTVAANSVGVEIAGPVARIDIVYDAENDLTSKTFISDIYFDTFSPPTGGEPGDGSDTILGGAGNDTIYGEGGDDTIRGEEGDDTLLGNAGDDTIDGGSGADAIDGNSGDDTIRLGRGDDDDPASPVDSDPDVASGGAGRDTFLEVGAGDMVDGGSAGVDQDTLDLRGSAPPGGSLAVTIAGPDSDGNGVDGTVHYFDDNGDPVGASSFANIENIIPCFTPGTLIATARGEIPVERLRVGDRIITRDNGIQKIRWVGHRRMTRVELAMAPHLRPIRIRRGALGHGLPERDMMVSPNHRFLVASEKTVLYFEENEVLVAAKHLTGLEGVDLADAQETAYLHFMFDQHEVILSDGSWTESFQPGDQTLGVIGAAQRDELFEIFPDLQSRDGIEAYCSARRSLKKHEARLLLVE